MAIKTYTKGQKNQLSKNFISTEFDCQGKGCCSSTQIDEELITYLQQIRNHFGKSVNINSGYRCQIHNANIGGATRSNHMDGEAADIRINGIAPIEIARYAESIGIKGIGVYSWGVHIDTRIAKYFWYDGGESNVATFGKPSNISNINNKPATPSIDTSKVNTSAINDKTMWNYFKSKGLNDYGVAGLMGNLYAESGFKPTNLQNTYEKKLGMTDAEYTAAVDNGTYTNFVKDSAGYGLPQWTYWSLKQDFLNYAKNKDKSIGDGEIQMEFLAHQLSTDFASVWSTLKNATSILEASNAVLLKFERPADQSTKVQNQRAEFGKVYYDKYATKQTVPATPVAPVKPTGFTNSPLVNYTKISPNKTSPRNHKIDTITIHCVVGQCSVETLGNIFASTSRQASCNYGIGYDGKIGMYVEEKDRSWCTSNSSNDHRAITIEVASDTTHPYAVKDAAYKALIDLLVDICERNDIKELKWKADKSLIGQVDKQNMTVHRWFANKECPGKYLYDRHGDIAEQVNKRLNVNISTKPEEKPTNPQFVAKELYRVRKSWEDVKSQIGVYSILDNAKKACDIAGPNYKVFNSTGKQVHPEVEEFPYLVKIDTSVLNVRAGAGTNYKVTNQVKRNQVYTIVDEKNGWGKLKSGAGWICLDYTERCYG